MLESITPLGERGRGSTWSVTVTFFGLGSVAAGAMIGGAVAGVGRVVALDRFPPASRLAALAVLIALGFLVDTGRAHFTLPTIHRQVNEQWLFQYRSWYYGVGFGFQLGLGIVTIITTSAVYLCLAACLLSASPLGGALIGAAFGLTRAATVLAAARVNTPERLADLGRALERWNDRSRRVTAWGMLGVALMAGVLAMA